MGLTVRLQPVWGRGAIRITGPALTTGRVADLNGYVGECYLTPEVLGELRLRLRHESA